MQEISGLESKHTIAFQQLQTELIIANPDYKEKAIEECFELNKKHVRISVDYIMKELELVEEWAEGHDTSKNIRQLIKDRKSEWWRAMFNYK